MIPANFDYIAAKSLDEAISLLARHKDDAKILAGGHSLLPAMKLRLMQPKVLIDLGRIRDLSYIKEEGGQIRIGAMTTHFQVEISDVLRRSCPLLPETASHLGDMQVRNKGTIGGSLAHSDPAADWPAAILALDAEIVATSAKGDRVIKATDFFVEMLTTSLQSGEILREIHIPTTKGKAAQAYVKVRHPASGFAVVGVAVNLLIDGGKCQSAGIGITGVSPKPYRAAKLESALKGNALDAKTLSAAAGHAADGVDVNSDLYASAEYRKQLATVYTRRAIEMAAGRAK
ncbi:MAG TPA: xanthine dehydrogenase family protein subunit M [Candidatus Angelobacter sp.]|jgi:carbon-monoxide dehydrogenase medium subunit|nr:xanthine dehydrogenase family protein subunit M [Candidatus Angelobacter sp.]